MIGGSHSKRPTSPRRRFLGALGSVTAAATAGCLDLGVGKESDEPEPRSELATRLGDAAISLDTTDPAAPLDDVAPLGDILASHSIVGLGEATHGTREFVQLKHRILRSLIEDHGLRTIGIETGFAEVTALDEYLTTGAGDADTAMEGFYRIWHSQSLRTMIEWLREFNDGRPVDDQVRCYGFDMQTVMGSAGAVRSFLEQVDPEYLETVDDDLYELQTTGLRGSTTGEDPVVRLREIGAELAERFDAQAATYREANTDVEWSMARQHVRILQQAGEFHASRRDEVQMRPAAVRDRSMAENVAWIRNYADADLLALWAHNEHVKRGRYHWTDTATMGDHLAEEYGGAYYPLGFEFGHGSFRARSGMSGGFRSWTLDAPAHESLAADLADVEDDLFALDFEIARRDERLSEWLSGSHRIHSIGQIFGDNFPERDYHGDHPIGDDFDGLCYVDETTALRR